MSDKRNKSVRLLDAREPEAGDEIKRLPSSFATRR
jgi:hypothetical protein